jgi:hypothetical protein
VVYHIVKTVATMSHSQSKQDLRSKPEVTSGLRTQPKRGKSVSPATSSWLAFSVLGVEKPDKAVVPTLLIIELLLLLYLGRRNACKVI